MSHSLACQPPPLLPAPTTTAKTQALDGLLCCDLLSQPSRSFSAAATHGLIFYMALILSVHCFHLHKMLAHYSPLPWVVGATSVSDSTCTHPPIQPPIHPCGRPPVFVGMCAPPACACACSSADVRHDCGGGEVVQRQDVVGIAAPTARSPSKDWRRAGVLVDEWCGLVNRWLGCQASLLSPCPCISHRHKRYLFINKHSINSIIAASVCRQHRQQHIT